MTSDGPNSIKILHLITRFKTGGAEKTTEDTLKILQRVQTRNYDLHLGVGSEYDPQRLKLIEENGIDTTVFHYIRHYNPPSLALAVFQVAIYLYLEDIQIIHTHSTEAGIVGRWAAFIARTKVVIHEVHGDPISKDRSILLNIFIKQVESLTAKITDLIICNSNRIRELFLNRSIGRPEQYIVIPDGVNVEMYANAGPADTVGDNLKNKTILLFVGRLVDGKGLFDLLDAFTRLVGENQEIHLLVVGEGELKEQFMEAIKKKNLTGFVSVLGYRSDVPGILAISDMLVLPSYREGTPRVITEARAAGVPVVATNIAGIPDQIEDGIQGYLIPPGDIDALTNRLKKLIDDPLLREKMGNRATKNLEEFEKERVKKKYIEKYEKLSRYIHGNC